MNVAKNDQNKEMNELNLGNNSKTVDLAKLYQK